MNSRRYFLSVSLTTLLLVTYGIYHGDYGVFAQANCSGNQATNESTPNGNVYVQSGQTLHVNINLPGISQQQLTDIQNGIQSWAGTSGLQIIFDSSSPGQGVVSVGFDTTISSTGEGYYSTGGYSGTQANQVTSGKISFNFGYQFSCSTGTCPAYNPSGANADTYLTGLAAHEMGHVLGLSEPTDTQSDPCTQTSNSVMGGQCGTNNNGDGSAPPAPTNTSPTPCDTQSVVNQTTTKGGAPAVPPKGSGKTGGPYEYAPPVGTNGGGPGGACSYYDEWDDSTNTVTEYSEC